MASDEPIDGRCAARVKNAPGKFCTQRPVRGTNRCKVHGGLAPQVREKGQRRLAETQAMKMLEQLGADPADDRHPVEHLLGELRQAAVAADYLGSIAVMDGPKGPLWHAWERERDRHAKIAKLALDAGVNEREVQLKEAEAERVAAVIRAVLSAVNGRLQDVLGETLVPPGSDEPMIVLDHQDRARLEAAVRDLTMGVEGVGIVKTELRKLAGGDGDGHGTSVE